MKTLAFALFFGLLLSAPVSPAAHAASTSDEAIFARYIEQMAPQKQLSTGELMVETARFFVGRPYVASTLEKEPEQLVINFRELDCMTLVETATALTRVVREGTPSFAAYAKHLQAMRYRDGRIRDYTDRLHYTTDWIFENQRLGRLKDVTRELGGQPHQVKVSFMTEHPQLYKPLRGQPQLVASMLEHEKAINARAYWVIPQAAINAHASKIQNGDIVCFVTSREGLDISHVGILYHLGDKLTFIHASTKAMQVVIEEKSLQEYAQSVPKNIGIMVVRLQF